MLRLSSPHDPPMGNLLRFLSANTPYESAKVILVGCPLDMTSSFRPGTRFGPNAIREASWNLESYSHTLEKDLEELPICDIGDVNLPLLLEEALETLREFVKKIASAKKVPFLLGGEHLLSFPAVKALKELYPDLVFLQVDAHSDFRNSYLDASLSHATVARRIFEELGEGKVFQVGVRSWDKRERQEALGKVTFLGETPPMGLPATDFHLYLSLDLDVLDPSVCPGVSTPEPGGWSFKELVSFLGLIPWEKIVGVDIVELTPPYDPGGISALVAAKLVKEVLLRLAG